MTHLRNDIAAYDRVRPELEANHRGQWAVFHAGDFIGVYPDFESAASEAVERFDAGPYLIRQIGVEAISPPFGIVFRLAHAHSGLGDKGRADVA